MPAIAWLVSPSTAAKPRLSSDSSFGISVSTRKASEWGKVLRIGPEVIRIWNSLDEIEETIDWTQK
jgi:hypothetical protein